MEQNDENSVLDCLTTDEARVEGKDIQPLVSFSREEDKEYLVGEADTEEVCFLMDYIARCLKAA